MRWLATFRLQQTQQPCCALCNIQRNPSRLQHTTHNNAVTTQNSRARRNIARWGRCNSSSTRSRATRATGRTWRRRVCVCVCACRPWSLCHASCRLWSATRRAVRARNLARTHTHTHPCARVRACTYARRLRVTGTDARLGARWACAGDEGVPDDVRSVVGWTLPDQRAAAMLCAACVGYLETPPVLKISAHLSSRPLKCGSINLSAHLPAAQDTSMISWIGRR